MNIQYLQEVKDNPILEDFTNIGLSLEEIEALESKYNNGNHFPKAFREYLYLAGEFNNFAFDAMALGLDGLQDLVRKQLARYQQKIDRPFFAFHQGYGGSVFTFLYLDENKDDPDLYIADPVGVEEEGLPLIVTAANNYTFSGLVNEYVRRAKAGLPI